MEIFKQSIALRFTLDANNLCRLTVKCSIVFLRNLILLQQQHQHCCETQLKKCKFPLKKNKQKTKKRKENKEKVRRNLTLRRVANVNVIADSSTTTNKPYNVSTTADITIAMREVVRVVERCKVSSRNTNDEHDSSAL